VPEKNGILATRQEAGGMPSSLMRKATLKARPPPVQIGEKLTSRPYVVIWLHIPALVPPKAVLAVSRPYLLLAFLANQHQASKASL
jgi:hypothetical protein